jgi:hypothetical protein
MTKEHALIAFKETIIPWIAERYETDGVIDHVARRTAWNDYTDMLCKDGMITEHQYETWDNPF